MVTVREQFTICVATNFPSATIGQSASDDVITIDFVIPAASVKAIDATFTAQSDAIGTFIKTMANSGHKVHRKPVSLRDRKPSADEHFIYEIDTTAETFETAVPKFIEQSTEEARLRKAIAEFENKFGVSFTLPEKHAGRASSNRAPAGVRSHS